jgi:hypothetical protein
MRLVWAGVVEIARAEVDIQELAVHLDDGSEGRALNYPALAGACVVGDRVLLNTTAVGLGLGTGGKHFVVARLGESTGVSLDDVSGGHIMKLRYSPLQLDVLAVESPESPDHELMQRATNLAGLPVVCCGLHSQVPLVAAAVKQADPSLRVAYCMTDSAALALPLSDVVRASVSAGLLDATITCGQAFGGRYEAVNVHSGLLAARHVVRADVAIVAIGPGVVGTATPYGHGGVSQGEALNAVASLGGTPIAALRISFADTRERHRVVSHHSIAALSQIALAPSVVALPTLPDEFAEQVQSALEAAGICDRHRCVRAMAGSTPPPDQRGVSVQTMGRGPADDPAFFSAAYAAGEVAARAARGERV